MLLDNKNPNATGAVHIYVLFPTSKSLPTSKRGCEDLQPHIERCQSTFSKKLNGLKKL